MNMPDMLYARTPYRKNPMIPETLNYFRNCRLKLNAPVAAEIMGHSEVSTAKRTSEQLR